MVYKSAITPPIRDVAVYNPSGRCYNIYKNDEYKKTLFLLLSAVVDTWIPVLEKMILPKLILFIPGADE